MSSGLLLFFSGSGQSVLGLHLRQLGLLFLRVHLLECFTGLVVEDHQVAVANVEAGQVIAGVLGIKDVLVHHEGRPFRFRRVSPTRIKVDMTRSIRFFWEMADLHSDLSDGPELAKDVVHFLGGDFIRQVPDVKNPIDFRRQSHVRSLSGHRHDEAVDEQRDFRNTKIKEDPGGRSGIRNFYP